MKISHAHCSAARFPNGAAEAFAANPDDVGHDFQAFADRLSSGEDAAATELFNRYSARLVTLARQKLSARVATKSDPEDVVQSVLRTFFRRLGTQEVELRDWPSLWGLLSVLTIRKCAMRGRAFHSASRDVQREVPLSSRRCPELSIPSREPTPVEVSTCADLLEQLLVSVIGRDRAVIRGLIAGESTAELSRRLECTERTIYRTTERVRTKLLRMLADDERVGVSVRPDARLEGESGGAVIPVE